MAINCLAQSAAKTEPVGMQNQKESTNRVMFVRKTTNDLATISDHAYFKLQTFKVLHYFELSYVLKHLGRLLDPRYFHSSATSVLLNLPQQLYRLPLDCYTTSISAPTRLIPLHVFEVSFCFMVRFQIYTKYEASVHYSPFSYF